MKAKKTKAKAKKSAAKKRARRQIDPVWITAVADIVASCVARANVQGEDVSEATTEIARSLTKSIPRAERVLVLRGYPPNVTNSRIYAYALLEVEAHDAARESSLPPDAIFSYSMRAFNAYISGRN